MGGFLGLILGVLGVRMLLLLIPGTSRVSIRLNSGTRSSSSTGEFLSSPSAFPPHRHPVRPHPGASDLQARRRFHLKCRGHTILQQPASKLHRQDSGRRGDGPRAMLLISAALLIRTFAGLSSAESGIDPITSIRCLRRSPAIVIKVLRPRPPYSPSPAEHRVDCRCGEHFDFSRYSLNQQRRATRL